MRVDLTRQQIDALIGACISRQTELEDRSGDIDTDLRQVNGEMKALNNAWAKLARALRGRRS